MLRLLTIPALVGLLIVSGSTVSASAAPPASAARRCAALTGLPLPDTAVLSARTDTRGAFVVPKGQGGPGEEQPGQVLAGLPDFCAVELVRTNPPAHDRVHVEVWLPLTTWNGRFQGVGGGGYVSGLSFRAMSVALKSGYAVASTDAGHPAARGIGDFVLTPSRQLKWPEITDFGGRAVHEMTTIGKDVTRRFYRTVPRYSYFTGCSQGGRQALTEAQRYPEDYDGIVAGSTAVDFPTMVAGQLWPQIVMHTTGDQVPECKFDAFRAAAVAACDELDGVRDGVIDDVADCHVDARALIGTRTDCGVITRSDADVMMQIWRGPRSPDGKALWYGLEPGSNAWVLAGAPLFLAVSWFSYWIERDPGFDWRTLSLSTYSAALRQGSRQFPMVAGDDPDLHRFDAAGGKLLLWTGLSDPLIPPQGTINYYEQVVDRSGGTGPAKSFARLFVAPGAGHCGLTGNTGPVPADPLGALIPWVERGTAPASILATRAQDGHIVQSRPVCAYPYVARYRGHGNTDSAANFVCARHFPHPARVRHHPGSPRP